MAIVQSKKALRDIKKKIHESSVKTNDTSVVIKVEDKIECDESEGATNDSKGKKLKSPELFDIKKNMSEEYSYNESSMEEATGSQIHGDSGEFILFNNIGKYQIKL